MPLRPIKLSSAVARGFVADMRARAGLLGGERISGFGRDRPAKGPARESSGVTRMKSGRVAWLASGPAKRPQPHAEMGPRWAGAVAPLCRCLAHNGARLLIGSPTRRAKHVPECQAAAGIAPE